MLEQRKIDALIQAVRHNENVNLAVAFEGSQPEAVPSAYRLLVDCERSDPRTIECLCSDVCRRLGEAVPVLTLADARSAPPLLHRALGEGVVLKDYYGAWDRLLQADEIECPAEGRDRSPRRPSVCHERRRGRGSQCGARRRTPEWRLRRRP
jgi:hypothetical protein